jgi:hypothetical protein
VLDHFKFVDVSGSLTYCNIGVSHDQYIEDNIPKNTPKDGRKPEANFEATCQVTPFLGGWLYEPS